MYNKSVTKIGICRRQRRRPRRESNPYICDFSRGGLNARFEATNMLYFLMDCCVNLVRFDFPDYFYLS